jgi:Flp pilus assembly protein TadG
VEFAFVMPFLLLLLLGTIEFGWLFSQHIDLRHGAREGARLAAVDFGTSASIISEVCDRMDVSSDATVTVSVTRSGGDIGDSLEVSVSKPIATMTGFVDWAFPSGSEISSSVESRLEQIPSWTDGTGTC